MCLKDQIKLTPHLVAETSGRIALVPKALLDPRRPTIPTAEDRQEQLIPYTPQLNLSPMSYVTYNKTVGKNWAFKIISLAISKIRNSEFEKYRMRSKELNET